MKLTQEWLEQVAEPLGCLPAELLPEAFTRPYLSPAEIRLLDLFRHMDDVDQLRALKVFIAFCEPVTAVDIQLSN